MMIQNSANYAFLAAASREATCYDDHDQIDEQDDAAAGDQEQSQPQSAAAALPVIEQRILVLMKQREQELKAMALSNRALALVMDRSEITKLIQLR